MPHPLTPEKQSTSQKFSDRVWWAVTPIDGLLSTPRLTNDNIPLPHGTLRVTASLFLTCHYLPAAVASSLHHDLPWQIQNEGSAAWLVLFPGPEKSDRQPTPQGLSLSLKTTIQLNHGRPPICKHLHLQSFWCWDSLSAEIKRHINSRIGRCLRHPWQNPQVRNSCYQLFFLLTEEWD